MKFSTLSLLLICFFLISAKSQAQCDATNSPTFQVVTNQATLATNGICGAQILFLNANSTPPGGGVIMTLMAPGQFTVPFGTYLNVAGIYTVYGQQFPSNCITSQTVQINVWTAPSITLAASSTLVCFGEPVTLAASGANSYSWNTNTTAPSFSVLPAFTSTYTVIGTGSKTCSSSTSVVIQVIPIPNIVATANQNTVCVNNQVLFTASGANTYTWNNTTTGSQHTSPTYTVPGPIAYSFQIQGTGNSGCVATKTISVNLMVDACDVGINFSEPKDNNASISIFPNPTEAELNVNNASENNIQKICIVNSLGQVMRLENVEVKNGGFIVPVSGLENGIYFLQLFTNSGIQTKQFIKN